MTKLATIGYEGACLTDFISTLVAAGIQRVIDIREVAQSRRPGFSKNGLRSALSEAEIDYHHLRQLGDPKHGREAARRGDFEQFRSIFQAHMDLPASREALTGAVALASEKPSVLLCFERNPRHCHRSIVANYMIALSSMKIADLGVQPRITSRTQADARPSDGLLGAC